MKKDSPAWAGVKLAIKRQWRHNPGRDTQMSINTVAPSRCLELVEENKLPPLLGPQGDERWEASGVCAAAGQLYVIFDNTPHVARLVLPPWPGGPRPALTHWRGQRDASLGYEDVAYDPF